MGELYIDPQQELFSRLKVELETRGYAVYDGALPPENTPYPFIYLGDFQQTDNALKNAVTGSVFPTIHVWHNNYKQRGTVSAMLLDIKAVCFSIDHTPHFSWMARNATQRIFSDTTTKAPLLHGVLEPEFMFS